MKRAYKYRLNPTPEQIVFFNNTSVNGMDATLYVSDVLKQVPRRVYADTLIVN